MSLNRRKDRHERRLNGVSRSIVNGKDAEDCKSNVLQNPSYVNIM